MSESSDPDGTWVVVNQETDSETSSVVAVCETECHSESLSECEGDDLWKNDWCNRDEIITDSDIEACAEEKEESDNDCSACTQISVGSLTQCFEDKRVITTSTDGEQGVSAASQTIDKDEESHKCIINGKESQSDYVKCMNIDSLPEEENDGEEKMKEESPILSTASSASDFEKLALSDARSLSSDEELNAEEETSVAVTEQKNDISCQEKLPLIDSASQTNNVSGDQMEASVQAVSPCSDAFTEPEVVSSCEKNESVTLGHRQRFVLPLIMIGVGFFLGRCSVQHSRMLSNYAFNSNSKKLMSNENGRLDNPALRSYTAPHSSGLSPIPCATNQDMLCPVFKTRIDKEFERHKTHIEMLKKQLQNTRSEYSTRVDALERNYRSKEHHWQNLELVHKTAIASLQANEKQLTEKYSGMKLRVQRYRSESRRLISEISSCKRRSRYLQSTGERSSRLNGLRDVSMLSPLIHTLKNEIGTCQISDRLKCGGTWMEARSTTEDTNIKSLELDHERNSLAIQALYHAVTDQSRMTIVIDGSYELTGQSMWHPYIHLAVMRSQMERNLRVRSREYHHLEATCLVANQSLIIVERQKANVKRRLSAAKAEIKLLHQEKNDLKIRLRNVTIQLKQKSSLQNCVKSAIADEVVKLNDSRLYKTANKLAEKVTKTSRKAWYTLQKLAKKLSQKDDDTVNKYAISRHKVKHGKKGKVLEHKKQYREKRSHKHARWNSHRDVSDKNHEEGAAKKETKKLCDYHYKSEEAYQDEKRSTDTEYEVKSRFDAMVSDHVVVAKKAGEAVMNQLAPIYQTCEMVYHDVKKKIAQKSFQEVWDSVVESTKTIAKENNFTKYIPPMIQDAIPYSWAFGKRSQGNPDTFQKEPKSTDRTEKTLGNEVSSNPHWFLRMFQEREMLRKVNTDSPLSEAEFDWFLQMFAERERLRQSDDDYLDDGINDNDIDWYLKMFESRARLRFQNDEDNTNWYIKMSAARRKARMERQKLTSSQWYADMFRARKSLREKDIKHSWYNGKAAMRQEQEKATFHRDGRCKA